MVDAGVCVFEEIQCKQLRKSRKSKSASPNALELELTCFVRTVMCHKKNT